MPIDSIDSDREFSDRDIVALSERPDLRQTCDALVASNVPAFMMWASPGNWHWHRIYTLFPDLQLAMVHPRVGLVATLHSAPMEWNEGRSGMPDGYDGVLVRATDGTARSFDACCLLSISVQKEFRARGIVAILIREIQRRVSMNGTQTLLAPLRPTLKHQFPFVPMAEYIAWTTESGEPFDPWLRSHTRMGAEVLGVAERSLVIRAASLPLEIS